MTPTAMAPMSGRVWLKVSMASLNPWPGTASTWAGGTRTSSSTSAAVSLARWPSLSSCRPGFTPLCVRSTMKAPIPLYLRAGSAVAKTT